MGWTIKSFHELTSEQLYKIIKERINVFVVEQDCPYPELDDKDFVAYHLFNEEDGEIIAYARIFSSGLYYDEASFGRVIVKETFRKRGMGRELLKRAISFIHDELKENDIKIQAQDYLRDFYASFQFKSITDVYLEDNIPHVDMIYKR
ncbi:GNAT family N-acetyltransferase [Evansella cellulosilytica]|uniref:GCN5-related N-acetyltransferase n=1 Tax=Evansella cellulosilytica (strain ATCC 21833 / DSM 2522 / FERM P-1141 / JCM 9156 / N-4) TaxID=649639 RepID=E6U050_EVAC2|nr:GNAT family N-acetyltransferase [Evansella cellulosilytica]ADU29054.1 GCN5-related N-acetyltransferase [Evansella cellulosilytica DSM 2522]